MLPVLSDGSNRTAQQDVWLGGHLIPKGTMVWLFFNGMFNSSRNWDNPASYCPVPIPGFSWYIVSEAGLMHFWECEWRACKQALLQCCCMVQ